MNEKEIVRDIMKTAGIIQSELAEKTGYAGPSAISEILNRKGMRVDLLLKLVQAMDCKVIIKSSDYEWELGGEKKELRSLNKLLED